MVLIHLVNKYVLMAKRDPGPSNLWKDNCDPVGQDLSCMEFIPMGRKTINSQVKNKINDMYSESDEFFEEK